MLAGIGNYIHGWQFPLFAVFIFGWLMGGGYLFQKSLIKATGKKRTPFSRGVFVSFLAGSVGAVPALVTVAIGFQFNKNATGLIVGAIPAVGFFLLFSIMTVYAMHKISFSETIRAAMMPLIAIAALGGVVSASCGIPAYFIHQDNLEKYNKLNQALRNMKEIHYFLNNNANRMNPPATLNEMIKRGLDKKFVSNPAFPDHQPPFYYIPLPEEVWKNTITWVEKRKSTFSLISHPDPESGFRLVIYCDGNAETVSPPVFDQQMEEKYNQRFKAVLKN